MECRSCGSPLERPGDFCLVCRSANADSVVLDIDRDRAAVTPIRDGTALGTTAVTTVPESGDERPVEVRNFAGRIADQVRRKRPEEVYAVGDREVLRAVREDLHHDLYRVEGEDPVAAVLEGADGDPLDTVDAAPAEKLGGSHSTLIGDRAGWRAVQAVAGHPHVKKVVPGPIDAGGTGSQSGLRAKVTRAGAKGNVRLLLRDGSSVQENRIVTTARDYGTGERVRDDLEEILEDADLH